MDAVTKKNLEAALAVAANFPPGTCIALVQYENAETYGRFVAESALFPWENHCRMVLEVAAALRKSGYNVEVRELTEAGYRAWLGDRLNHSETRAQYVAELNRAQE